MAERQLPKLDVASSSLVSRFSSSSPVMGSRTQVAKGAVCKTAIHQFDSGRLLLPSIVIIFTKILKRPEP
jgi:hypothetical protein